MNNKQAERVLKVRRILADSCGQLDFPGTIVDKIQPRVAVHVNRRGGKTKSLLQAIYEREQGKAILVLLNGMYPRTILQAWNTIAIREQNDHWQVYLPIIVDAFNAHNKILGRSEPIYCDEWFMYSGEVQSRLISTGRLAGAVGTDPMRNYAAMEVLSL